MKQCFLCISCILIIFTTRASFLLAQDPPDHIQVPLGTMTLQVPAHFQTKKTPVLFTHSTHLKFSCPACHHDWDRSGPVQGCTASGCHEKLRPTPPSGKQTQAKKIPSITGAYHKACRGCHRDQLKQGIKLTNGHSEHKSNRRPTGPIACEGCHPDTFTARENFLDSFSMPLGIITIAPPQGVDAKRAAVNFPHSLHFDQDCQVCHHGWDGSEKIQNCTTSGCHDQLEADESTRNINDPNNSQYFLTAYHKTCFHCHLDLKKQKKMLVKSGMNKEGDPQSSKDAPVRCNECHNE